MSGFSVEGDGVVQAHRRTVGRARQITPSGPDLESTSGVTFRAPVRLCAHATPHRLERCFLRPMRPVPDRRGPHCEEPEHEKAAPIEDGLHREPEGPRHQGIGANV